MIIRIDKKILLFSVKTIFISKSILNVYSKYFDSTSIAYNKSDTLIKWVSSNVLSIGLVNFIL